MDLIEFIGFIITFLAFLYLMFRRVLEDVRRKTQPSEELRRKNERTQDEQLKEFLRSLEIDMEETEDYGEEPLPPVKSSPPPIPPKVLKNAPVPFQYHPKEEVQFEVTEEFHQPDVISQHYLKHDKLDPYAIKKQDSIETLKALAQRSQKQKLVIYKEILDRPKSLQ